MLLKALRLRHAADSRTKIFSRRALRARYDTIAFRSGLFLARCLQAQEGGAVQARAEKVVKTGEVSGINCSQVSPAFRGFATSMDVDGDVVQAMRCWYNSCWPMTDRMCISVTGSGSAKYSDVLAHLSRSWAPSCPRECRSITNGCSLPTATFRLVLRPEHYREPNGTGRQCLYVQRRGSHHEIESPLCARRSSV
jgi:hypothetical protein